MNRSNLRAAHIVRAGRLRVGLFPSFFYARTAAGFSGWAIEMARALADGLGVALDPVERASPPDVVACLAAGDCDVAFLGISAERARDVDFTPPWVQAEFTFLVRPGSNIAAIADVDRTGLRVAVVARHAMADALDSKLTRPARLFAETPDAAFALFQSGAADVLAGIRPGLTRYAARIPGAHVLEDSYGANVIGLAVAKDRPGWHGYVCDFVADSKTNGTAQAAAVRTGAHGLQVVVQRG